MQEAGGHAAECLAGFAADCAVSSRHPEADAAVSTAHT